jgi:uncharacterized protein YbjQ (UPF0145 family)
MVDSNTLDTLVTLGAGTVLALASQLVHVLLTKLKINLPTVEKRAEQIGADAVKAAVAEALADFRAHKTLPEIVTDAGKTAFTTVGQDIVSTVRDVVAQEQTGYSTGAQ